MTDLIKRSEEVANEHGASKLTPAVLKQALLTLDGYDFMKDLLDDVEEEIVALPLRKSSSRQPKRTKSEGEKSNEREKRGRKRNKLDEEKEVNIVEDEEEHG